MYIAETKEELRAEIAGADPKELANQKGAVRRLRHIARRAYHGYALQGRAGLTFEEQLGNLQAAAEDLGDAQLSAQALELAKKVVEARAAGTQATKRGVHKKLTFLDVPETQDGAPAKKSGQFKANALAEAAQAAGFVVSLADDGGEVTFDAKHKDGRAVSIAWQDGVSQPGTRRRTDGTELVVRNVSDIQLFMAGDLV